MGYRDTPAGEIRIWLDADYANSDRDELLAIVFSEDERARFVDSWADKKASAIAKKGSVEFSAVKEAFKKQLCFTGKLIEQETFESRCQKFEKELSELKNKYGVYLHNAAYGGVCSLFIVDNKNPSLQKELQ